MCRNLYRQIAAAVVVAFAGVAAAAPPAPGNAKAAPVQGKLVPVPQNPQPVPPVAQGKASHHGRGIGPEVSAAAHIGIHGQQLATFAHATQVIHGIGQAHAKK